MPPQGKLFNRSKDNIALQLVRSHGSSAEFTARPDRSESGFPKDSEGASLTH
jgi:hypothetical protein